MHSPILTVLTAARVPLLTSLPRARPDRLRYVMVDVSASLQQDSRERLSTAEAIEEYMRWPLNKHKARLGVFAFDCAPTVPLTVAMSRKSQDLELRLPLGRDGRPRLYTRAELENLSQDHCAALDGSLVAQWQWHSLTLLPGLKHDLSTNTAQWPPMGVILDGIVERETNDAVYHKMITAEIDKIKPINVTALKEQLGADMEIVYGRILARALVGSKFYRRLHLSQQGKRRALDRLNNSMPGIPPAEGLCKIMRNVAALALENSGGAPVADSEIVLVTPRGDAVLYLLGFLNTLQRDFPAAKAPTEWLYLELPGDVYIDVVATSAILREFGASIGVSSFDFMLVYLNFAGASERLSDALWRTLPRPPTDVPPPGSFVIVADGDGEDDEYADDVDGADGPIDPAQVPLIKNQKHDVNVLVAWFLRAQRLLLQTNDSLIAQQRLLDLGDGAVYFVRDTLARSFVQSALFQCLVYYSKAWQMDGLVFYLRCLAKANEWGRVQREYTSPSGMADVMRNRDGVRYDFLRNGNDFTLSLWYVAQLEDAPPKRGTFSQTWRGASGVSGRSLDASDSVY